MVAGIAAAAGKLGHWVVGPSSWDAHGVKVGVEVSLLPSSTGLIDEPLPAGVDGTTCEAFGPGRLVRLRGGMGGALCCDSGTTIVGFCCC